MENGAPENTLMDFLSDQNIVVSYFSRRDSSRKQRVRFARSWLVIFVLAASLVRHCVLLSFPNDEFLALTLADNHFMLKHARQPLNMVYFLWNAAGLLIGAYVKYSQILPRRQKWMSGLTEFFSSDHYKGEKTSDKALNYLLRLVYRQRACVIAVAVLSWIPFFYQSPSRYYANGVFFTLFDAAVAFSTGSLLCNSAPLYAFTFYMYGRFYGSSVERIRRQKSFPLQFAQEIDLKQLADINRELHRTYQFFQPINNVAFVGTFLARILIIYYVFFTDLQLAFRISFFTFLPLNDQSGQSLIFLASSYAVRKVSKLF